MTNIVWSPQPGPQHAYVTCPLPIVFFGGARGGGKTDGVLGKWAIKEQQFGRAFNAIMFRRSTVSAEDAIDRSKEIYDPIGGKFSESRLIWKMPNGGRVSFKYLESVKDANEYQGRNVTDAWVEEAGQYAEPDPIDRLFGVLRSKSGVPIQLTLTANPGGAGQHWLRERFKLYPFPTAPLIVPVEVRNYLTNQNEVIEQAVIPSRIQDNKILMQNDPQYVARLSLTGGAKLIRAWVLGDWSAVEGAFFDEWSTECHVIRPFPIPDEWLRFGSFDWGSAKPFSMGWYAIAKDDYRDIPCGAMIKYREWYGKKSANVGLKLTAEQIAEGILEREDGEDINYRVADPAIFAADGGPSHAERMLTKGAVFWQADNKRVARKGAMGGWDMMRARLLGHGSRDDLGVPTVVPGDPMLYFFETCQDSIRTIPVLQHDEKKAEDLNTDQEDHAADECLVAQSMIETEDREKQINQLRVGDMVLTRKGYRAVNAVFTSGIKEVYEVRLSNGRSLIGTANHPVYVEGNGFVELSLLRYGDIMRPCTIQTNSEEWPAEFGEKLMGKSRRAIISTISTVTTRITTSRIWPASTIQHTAAFICQIGRSFRFLVSNVASRFLLSFEPLVFAQIDASRSGVETLGLTTSFADVSLVDTISHQTDLSLSGFARRNARLAGSTSVGSLGANASSAAESLSPAEKTQSGAVTVVDEPRIVGKRKVFNLSVDDEEEYFANGVLTHNCRYACMSRPWTPEATNIVTPSLDAWGRPRNIVSGWKVA